MIADLLLKNVPARLKSLISREAENHRRSINQEAIVLLEEALLTRAKNATANKDDIEAILQRYAQLPTLDARPLSEIIAYDEIGLPK